MAPGMCLRSGQESSRWLVVDVETSGLDAARDRLLAIAAIGLRFRRETRRLSLVLGDSFEVILRQELPSTKGNILVHGIGVQRQREGVPVPDALRSFHDYAAGAPLLAFHAAFDRTLIDRHLRAMGEKRPEHRWVDIEQLCAASHPEVKARSLDEWLANFGIHCSARHVAMADVMAEGELLLRIWPRIAAECSGWRDVERVAARHRWLRRH